MDKPPFSQTVVGALALGVVTWVVGGVALKWVTQSRSAPPATTTIAATATLQDQTVSSPLESRSSMPLTSASNAMPESATLAPQLPSRTPEKVTGAEVEKRKTQEKTNRAAQTQAASWTDQRRRSSYLAATHLPSKVEFLVCAETAARAPMGSFTTALTEHLNARGKAASGFVFSPEFVTSGAFDSYFVGRGGPDLQAMPVSSIGEKLFLARVNNSVKPGTAAGGLFTASVVVSFSVLSSNDGNAVDGFELKAVGPGTSETDAVSQALERILELLGQHGY
jgi:hypothetical protein